MLRKLNKWIRRQKLQLANPFAFSPSILFAPDKINNHNYHDLSKCVNRSCEKNKHSQMTSTNERKKNKTYPADCRKTAAVDSHNQDWD